MKLQNHYKDGFFDVCAEHGFLPVKDPIVSLPSTYADVQKILDDMPVVLPKVLCSSCLKGHDIVTFSQNLWQSKLKNR